MYLPKRADFDHVGIVTTKQLPATKFDTDGRSWITSPRANAANVEWLRFQPDSPVTGALRTEPHIAYRVADLDSALTGHDLIYPPFVEGNGFARSAFVLLDGVVVEFRQPSDPDDQAWWF